MNSDAKPQQYTIQEKEGCGLGKRLLKNEMNEKKRQTLSQTELELLLKNLATL